MRVGLLALVLLAGCASRQDESIFVFAAASLTDAVQALADEFQAAHPGYNVTISIGATSLLARQISYGAPADVFMAASPEWIQFLEKKGLLLQNVPAILRNRLVVIGHEEAAPMEGLLSLIDAGRIALADPSHVPAGVYARTALTCAGLWEDLAPQVIPVLDVRAAVVAVMSGAAEFAIVYASDARIAPQLKVLLHWPETCAPQIKYAAAVLSKTPNQIGAAAFLNFAADSARGSLWEQYGFEPNP